MHKLELRGDELVLDIGSGDGLLSSYIAKEFLGAGKLVGIDNSREMISFAVAHNESANIEYRYADICNYNVAPAYDAIVSFWTLHWIVDGYQKALKNIARALKPGGQAFLAHGEDCAKLAFTFYVQLYSA